jgi:hypothetical protein
MFLVPVVAAEWEIERVTSYGPPMPRKPLRDRAYAVDLGDEGR